MPKVPEERGLARSLDRTRRALAKRSGTSPAPGGRRSTSGPLAQSFAVAAIVLFILYFKLGLPWLLWLALALAAGGGLLFLAPQAVPFLGPLGLFDTDGGGVQIGMGASVASDAVLEPGARVEMGADVGPRAVVRADALVRMGASVGADAVIERGAVVSWGASVQKGAVVEAGATVGAGSDVLAGARVPAGMWLRPGSTFGGKSAQKSEALRPPPPVPDSDPRQARVTAVCGKLEVELRAAPERVREFLSKFAKFRSWLAQLLGCRLPSFRDER